VVQFVKGGDFKEKGRVVGNEGETEK